MTEVQNPYKPPSANLETTPNVDLPPGEHKFSRYARYFSWSFFAVVIGGSMIGTPPLLIVLSYVPGLIAVFFALAGAISVRRNPSSDSYVRRSAWVLSILAFIFTSILIAAFVTGFLAERERALPKLQSETQSVALRLSV